SSEGQSESGWRLSEAFTRNAPSITAQYPLGGGQLPTPSIARLDGQPYASLACRFCRSPGRRETHAAATSDRASKRPITGAASKDYSSRRSNVLRPSEAPLSPGHVETMRN